MTAHPEREPDAPPFREKLTAAAANDYPTASRILVSFPERWELVRALRGGDRPRYVAAFPPEGERPRRDHFYGLSETINLSLDTYRLYKLFDPWPTPILPVSWDFGRDEGRIERGGRLEVRLQELGQAQTWTGEACGVLWECLHHRTRGEANWWEELAQFWQAVEADMQVGHIFTLPADPAYPRQAYRDFLADLGYGPDREHPQWWSKEMA